MNGRTKIKNETCFVVARKEQHNNKHEGLKKKKNRGLSGDKEG